MQDVPWRYKYFIFQIPLSIDKVGGDERELKKNQIYR